MECVLFSKKDRKLVDNHRQIVVAVEVVIDDLGTLLQLLLAEVASHSEEQLVED